MAGWMLLIFSLLGFALVFNAWRPLRGPITILPSWLGVFLTTDLAPFHLALSLAIALACAYFGALDSWPGKAGLAVFMLSWAALLVLWLPAVQAGSLARRVAERMKLDEAPGVPRALMLQPFKRTRRGVRIVRDVEFCRVAGRVLRLDIYQPENQAPGQPALIYLHGGGWVLGDKRNQGLPLCNHMASLGWVCFNANYRLSPSATWPDHLDDARSAIAWVRRHGAGYGADPSWIAISGGSAGGHIAAMAALQPDGAEAMVQAVVTNYGVYDLTNRLQAHDPEFFYKMLGPYVIKAFPDTEPERFREASPCEHASGNTLPWLLLHGGEDTLVPVVEARGFTRRLQAASDAPVALAEFPGAAHAFEIYYSHRANAAVDLTARFLVTMHRRQADGTAPAGEEYG